MFLKGFFRGDGSVSLVGLESEQVSGRHSYREPPPCDLTRTQLAGDEQQLSCLHFISMSTNSAVNADN